MQQRKRLDHRISINLIGQAWRDSYVAMRHARYCNIAMHISVPEVTFDTQVNVHAVLIKYQGQCIGLHMVMYRG
jgi:hypothetical protein